MKLSFIPESPLRKKSFVFGVSTSSFQIEGGHETREISIWDTFCEQKGKIKDGSNGKVACNHYELWREDVELISDLGVDAYRFSISWPRVMHKDGSLREEGVQFYINLLEALNSKGIKPFVTLYHWDLPQYLEDEGGWLNRKTSYAFADYVDKITNAFGNRVYSYTTLNEPYCSAFLGHEVGVHAPGIIGKEYGTKAAHHLLLAHGLATEIIKKNAPKAKTGIVVNVGPRFPKTQSAKDIIAAQNADELYNQWYIRPILQGCYPSILESLPAEHRPNILEGDLEIISKPIDFLGINYYTREVYQYDPIEGMKGIEEKTLPITDIGWEIYPDGLFLILKDLHRRYQLPPIYITENGAAMKDSLENGNVMDLDRLDFFQRHLNALEEAINGGVNIKGYFAWSLIDNFEWAEGYTKRFGLTYVDYNTQKRFLKTSGKAFQEFLQSR